MKPLLAVLAFAAALIVPATTQAKASSWKQCPRHSHVNQMEITPYAPGGCAFAKAAERPLNDFALSNSRRGNAEVEFRGKGYLLSCTAKYPLVQCSAIGPHAHAWVRELEDTAGTPVN